MNLNPLLAFIKRLGRQNAAAIKTHHDIQWGKRGAFGLRESKSKLKGIACPHPRKVSGHEPFRLPSVRAEGTPLACTGPKCNGGDGYKRDRITGVITRA